VNHPDLGWLIVEDIIFALNVCLHTMACHSLQKLLYKIPLFKTFNSNERLILATYPKNVEQLESCVFYPVVAMLLARIQSHHIPYLCSIWMMSRKKI